MDTTTEALRAVGALPIPVFLCAQGAALALALALFARRLRRGGGVRSRSAVIAAGCGAVFGAALLGIALRMPRAFLGHGDEVFAPGLLMAYGALLGAPLAVAATSQDPAERVRRLAALAPSLGVLVSVGRLGCFFAGCCFGRPSGAPWAVAYPEGTPAFVHHATAGTLEPGAHATVHLHPTSLYEVLLGAVMIFVGATRAAGRRGVPVVLALYAVGRFVIETLRGDPRAFAGPLAIAQWLSIAVLAVAALVSSSATPPSEPVGCRRGKTPDDALARDRGARRVQA